MNITGSTLMASDIQADYMKILIAQLQNQNPLEPLDNNEMASQLAQLAQLAEIETMSSSFAEVLATTRSSYANSLIGRDVTFYATNEESGELEKLVGKVDCVFHDPQTRESLLGVVVGEGEEAQEYTLGLDAVVLVEG